jgi:hypothetical protein
MPTGAAVLHRRRARLAAIGRIAIAVGKSGIAGSKNTLSVTAKGRGVGQRWADDSFVDNPVAVVVETIANLGARLRGLLADEHPAQALRRARRANTQQTGVAGHATAGITIVDDAVAVVVKSVTGLHTWLCGLLTDELAAHARHRACRADARQAGVARCSAAGVTIVHSAIAVIVETVANFGSRRHLTHTRAEAAPISKTRLGPSHTTSDTCRSGWTGVTRLDCAGRADGDHLGSALSIGTDAGAALFAVGAGGAAAVTLGRLV